jgi:hypothetical protein
MIPLPSDPILAPRAAPTPAKLLAALPPGELVELAGAATAAVLARACAEAQREGETTAWVVGATEWPHPDDLLRAGVDLEGLVFIDAADVGARAGEGSGRTMRDARAAELLLACGGFGLVVVDGAAAFADRTVARLRALARRHEARLLVAPERAGSLGSTVSLRLAARTADGRLELEWLKNKAGSGGPLAEMRTSAPTGMALSPASEPARSLRLLRGESRDSLARSNEEDARRSA